VVVLQSVLSAQLALALLVVFALAALFVPEDFASPASDTVSEARQANVKQAMNFFIKVLDGLIVTTALLFLTLL